MAVEVYFMFTYLNDPKRTLKDIAKRLHDGWVLYALDDDKAHFSRITEDRT